MTHARKATSAKSEPRSDDTRVVRSRITAVSGQIATKGHKLRAPTSDNPVIPGRPSRGLRQGAGVYARRWCDARHFQIVALSSLLAVNFVWLDFGAKPLYSALAISSALATQVVCWRYFGLSQIDLRSPLVTGLSLSLLLRADEAWLPAISDVIAIASKFVLRVEGRHIWESRWLRDRRAAVDIQRCLDLARAMACQRLVWVAARFFCHFGVAGVTAVRRCAVLSRKSCRVAVCPRLLARRSDCHSAAPTTKRILADLCLFYDLRFTNDTGFTPGPLPIRGRGGVACLLSAFFMQILRRFTSRSFVCPPLRFCSTELVQQSSSDGLQRRRSLSMKRTVRSRLKHEIEELPAPGEAHWRAQEQATGLPDQL